MNSKVIISFLLGMLVASLIWVGVLMVADKKENEENDSIVVEDSEDEEVDGDNNGEEIEYNAGFIGDRWYLKTIDGEDKTLASAFIQFESDGDVNGFSGCNDFGSTYTIDDYSTGGEAFTSTITFEPFISTLKLCEATVDVETAMMNILDGVTTVEEDNSLLQLTLSGATGVLVFELRPGV
jgi:heat shock protein HslJ